MSAPAGFSSLRLSGAVYKPSVDGPRSESAARAVDSDSARPEAPLRTPRIIKRPRPGGSHWQKAGFGEAGLAFVPLGSRGLDFGV